MEFVDDIAMKRGEPSLLAVEEAKTVRAREIGRRSGLFDVPRVVRLDAREGNLQFERLRDLATLADLVVHKDPEAIGLAARAGQALSVIHDELVLPDELRHGLPDAWMGSAEENVFIHGDFGCLNVCVHGPSRQLVILDWSTAPLMGRTPTYGSRYFDVLWFASFMFRAAPCRRLSGWREQISDAFLRGYLEASRSAKLSELRRYYPEIRRLQRRNVRYLARQQTLLKAPAYTACQMFTYARLCRFLRRYEL